MKAFLSPLVAVAATAALFSSPVLAGDLSAPVTLSAPKPLPKHGWSLRAGGDIEFPVGGEFHTGAQTAIPAAAVGAPGPGTLPTNIQGQDYDDIFGTMYGGSLQLAFAYTERFSTFIGVGYLNGSADQVNVGTIGGLPTFAQFDDYEAWRITLGFEYNLTEGNRLTPYVSGFAGASFVESIQANISVPAAPATLSNVPFYDDSVVLHAGVAIGLDYEVNPDFSIGIETGLNYSGSLDDDDSALTGLGLNGLNDGDGLLTIPIRIYGKLHF